MEDSGGRGRLEATAGTFCRALRRLLLCVWTLTALCPVGLRAEVPQALSVSSGAMAYEPLLVRSLVQAREGRLEDALEGLRKLVEQEPDFELAQFVYADVLSSLSNGHRLFGRPAYEGLRQEALARLEHYLSAPGPNQLPDSVLQLSEDFDQAIVVDLSRYRLYLMEAKEDGEPRLEKSYYVSIGKSGRDKRVEGDERTPVGVYFVETYLPGDTLPALYGEGAYPVDYPNFWDRRLGRTGSGIWIHGTEWDRFSRAPQSSRGCVTLSNQDFVELYGVGIEVGTPVVFADEVRWADRGELERRKSSLLQAVSTWEEDWESRDVDRYLRHYAADFRSGRMDRAAWARHKGKVNPSKRYIDIELKDLALFRYPGEEELFLVSFRQTYDSDSFSSKSRKRQLWRLDQERWSIVQEEAIR